MTLVCALVTVLWRDSPGIESWEAGVTELVNSETLGIEAGRQELLSPVNSETLGHTPRSTIRTLVTTQLAVNKAWHFQTFLLPSWKRLMLDASRYSTEEQQVQADLFIACHPDICELVRVAGNCALLATNFTEFFLTSITTARCVYAPVEEQPHETYRFFHSLYFLQSKPFTDIAALNYYDFFMRTDADAMLLPGLLLEAPPTNTQAMIGSGFFGIQATRILVEHFATQLMPELGPNRHPNLDSMQSTFYVSKASFAQFVQNLIGATRTFHDQAFTSEICANLTKILEAASPIGTLREVVQCKWPEWHRGVSSLYGTRVAASRVQGDVIVTQRLDALSNRVRRVERSVYKVMQAHLLGWKHGVAAVFRSHLVPKALCTKGKAQELIKWFQSEAQTKRKGGGLFQAMTQVIVQCVSPYHSTNHYVADVIFSYYQARACQLLVGDL